MTYNSTLTKVFVYLLTSIEAIYQTSVPLEIQNRKNVHLATSDCLVITCYLWGVLHFSETLKAKHQLAQSLFPNFLEYSRFVRRCNALLPSIQLIRQALVFKEVEGIDVSIIDSFTLRSSCNSHSFKFTNLVLFAFLSALFKKVVLPLSQTPFKKNV